MTILKCIQIKVCLNKFCISITNDYIKIYSNKTLLKQILYKHLICEGFEFIASNMFTIKSKLWSWFVFELHRAWKGRKGERQKMIRNQNDLGRGYVKIWNKMH